MLAECKNHPGRPAIHLLSCGTHTWHECRECYDKWRRILWLTKTGGEEMLGLGVPRRSTHSSRMTVDRESSPSDSPPDIISKLWTFLDQWGR